MNSLLLVIIFFPLIFLLFGYLLQDNNDPKYYFNLLEGITGLLVLLHTLAVLFILFVWYHLARKNRVKMNTKSVNGIGSFELVPYAIAKHTATPNKCKNKS